MTDIETMQVLSLKGIHGIFQKHLHLPDTNRIDVVLATVLSAKHKGTPVWLIVVGPSGDGKSEILLSLEGLPNPIVKKIDQLNSKSLISFKKDEDGLCMGIGAELEGKSTVLLSPDLACMNSIRKEEKSEVWSQFRNLFDGFILRDTGSGHKEFNDCHVTFLAGSTTMIHEQFLQNNLLGSREFMYNTTNGNNDRIDKIKRAMGNSGKEKVVRKELQDAVQPFLCSHEFKEFEPNEEMLAFICDSAEKLSMLRAGASMDLYTSEVNIDVDPEVGTRLAKQFLTLYQGLKSLDDDYDDDKCKEIINHIVKSTGDTCRAKIVEIFETTRVPFSVPMIRERVRLSRSKVKKELEILWNLKFLDRYEQCDQVGNKWEMVAYYKRHQENTTLTQGGN